MPEDMPDRMPEDMSDRMPEDLPVTKCINVMVGITRSKVIGNLFQACQLTLKDCEWLLYCHLLQPQRCSKPNFIWNVDNGDAVRIWINSSSDALPLLQAGSADYNTVLYCLPTKSFVCFWKSVSRLSTHFEGLWVITVYTVIYCNPKDAQS